MIYIKTIEKRELKFLNDKLIYKRNIWMDNSMELFKHDNLFIRHSMNTLDTMFENTNKYFIDEINCLI